MSTLPAKEDPDSKGVHANGLSLSSKSHGLATRALHGGNSPNHWTDSPVIPPLYMSTTFETKEPGEAFYEYSRCDNPTRTELQSYLRSLESANHALVFSSGLGALTTASYLLQSGQHVLCCDDVYGGTHRFFLHCSSRMGIETTFVDGVLVKNWTDAFVVGKTKLVWIESPTNPTMKIVDIESVAAAIKQLDPGCVIVVDNTFMTPIFQSPLKMGADLVMHSCTKYINGHSDVIMGTLMTNNKELFTKLKFFQNALGIVPSAFDCYQVIRSIKTLQVRVQQQSRSAMELAKFLEGHDKVKKILYPGLKSHPQHQLALKQYSGFGGMMSIYVDVIKGDEVNKIVQALKVFHVAVSLGCVSSLIEVPSLMTHSAVPEGERLKLGIHDNLLRISTGLEDVEDLIADLEQAFSKAYD